MLLPVYRIHVQLLPRSAAAPALPGFGAPEPAAIA